MSAALHIERPCDLYFLLSYFFFHPKLPFVPSTYGWFFAFIYSITAVSFLCVPFCRSTDLAVAVSTFFFEIKRRQKKYCFWVLIFLHTHTEEIKFQEIIQFWKSATKNKQTQCCAIWSVSQKNDRRWSREMKSNWGDSSKHSLCSGKMQKKRIQEAQNI